MSQKKPFYFLTALMTLALSACLATPTQNDHPCETARHCIYDTVAGESQCKDGYTWADPSDASNYNCKVIDDDSCTPTTCVAQNANCGTLPDGCGGELPCGECGEFEVCGGGGPNLCGEEVCWPVLCDEAGAECGSISDGCGNMIDCGICESGFTCNESVIPPVCVSDEACVPDTCESLGLECGTASDGCGGTLDCGTCSTCGNGQIDSGEACDGNNLNGKSCESLGYDTGTLSCNADCTFSESQCENVNCPPNSHFVTSGGQSGCACDEGYQPNSNNDGCEEIVEEVCDTPNFKFPITPPSGRYSLLDPEENDSQIIMDTHTGYMFQKCYAGLSGPGCSIYEDTQYEMPTYQSFDEAQTYCADLGLGGFDDWELPPMDILMSTISSAGANIGGSPSVFGYGLFTNSYWPSEYDHDSLSSEPSGIEQISGSVAEDGSYWGVDLWRATTAQRHASNGGYVRCVRRTPEVDIIQSTPRCVSTVPSGFFNENIIEDSMTGLQWIGCSNSTCYGNQQQGAISNCADRGLGSIQWRLPTYHELITLLDFSKTTTPYSHGDIFPDIDSSGSFWTTTTTSGGNIWLVGLRNGYTHHTVYLDSSHGTAKYICVRKVE